MGEMSREVLEGYFKNLVSDISDIKAMVKDINGKIQSQDVALVQTIKDVEHNHDRINENKKEFKKEIEELKTSQKESKNNLWEEIRRRDEAQDKKSHQREIRQRWVIGTIISIGFLGMVILKYFG